MTDLAQIVAAWPFAASMAAVASARGLRAGRRREAVNEALHELRRPLQAIALASGSGGGDIRSSIELAAAALERLDREINGGAPSSRRAAFPMRPLVEAAVARWGLRARNEGGSLELRWRAGRALVEADRSALAQALDNLIVNALEHGGPTVVVAARSCGRRLLVSVEDSGPTPRSSARRSRSTRALARLSGRRRHGHGLAVVRRFAAVHGGRFVLNRSERGALAVLELPLAHAGAKLAA